MLSEIIIIALLTLLPTLELRASIPYGIFSTNLHWSVVFLIAVMVNILLGPIVYTFVDKALHIVLRIKTADKLYTWYQKKIQKKITKKVERYGELGLALFIGVPLPGSGSYSGAIAAHLLGINFKRFFLANVIGVLIAGIIVLCICLFGNGAWNFFIKV